MSDSSFLSRWSRRKVAVREGKPVVDEPAQPAAVPAAPGVPATVAPDDAPGPGPTGGGAPHALPQAEPLPTLADAALLKPGDSVARFVARGVDETVKRAALKTLFADPHFNVMDGLDIYIDDYSQSVPIPPDVLRRMTQSKTLGLFEPTDEEREAALAAAQEARTGGPEDVEPAPEADDADDAAGPAEHVEAVDPVENAQDKDGNAHNLHNPPEIEGPDGGNPVAGTASPGIGRPAVQAAPPAPEDCRDPEFPRTPGPAGKRA